jgi:RNA-splicing ligase RtcB
MRTDAVIYASERMVPQLREDNAPNSGERGVPPESSATPGHADIHWGYGFPIGGWRPWTQRRA